jgi:heterodisulfide reductase subunit A-like polyferredoxin
MTTPDNGYSAAERSAILAPLNTLQVIMERTDVLIIGSGLAALTTALHLAQQRQVVLLTKKPCRIQPAPGRRAALPPYLPMTTQSKRISATP